MHTTRHLRTIAMALMAVAVSPVLGWEHAAPPAGDECLTNRFGHSWSEPIGNGWLIVGGKYVDAPYIVEQRGYVIYVNGVRVEDGLDVRSVLPMPPPPPISTDPGFPTNLTRESPLGAVVWPPVYDLKQRYWDHLGLSGDARVKAQIDYFASLPNVARVEDTVATGNPAARGRLILYAHDGETMHMNILGGPRPQPAPPDDPGLFPIIERTAGRIADNLRRGETMFANGGFIVLQGHAIAPGEKWNKILGILSDRTLSPAQKVPLLKAFGLLEPGQGLDYANYALPMTNFLATTQLWTRVAGDATWTNDAPQMLARLTNGWARIPPKWVREPAIAPAAAMTNRTPVATVAPTPPPPPSPRTNAPPAVLTNAPSAVVRTAPPVRKSPPPPPRAKRAESSAPIWLIGMGALVAIVVLGWLLIRGRRS